MIYGTEYETLKNRRLNMAKKKISKKESKMIRS